MLKMEDSLSTCIDSAKNAMIDAKTILELSQAAGFFAGLLNGLRVSGAITKDMYESCYAESREILERRVG